MKFNHMLTLMNDGIAGRLPGWRDGEFIYLVESSVVRSENLRGNAALHADPNTVVRISTHIDKRTPDNRIECGWRPNVEELLSELWEEYHPRVR